MRQWETIDPALPRIELKRANSYLGKTGLLDTAGIAGPADIEEVERLNE